MITVGAAPARQEQLPPEFIESVKNAADIVSVVGRVVDLKKSGNNLFGRCPFHSEKSPSFSVSPAKQMYHCFGCGANGDAIKFLMEHAALSFREAVTELAEDARIPMPVGDGVRSAPIDLGGMLKANELSAAFFRHCLRHEEKAKTYVRSRKITHEAARKFLIGYAPEGWQSLQEAFPDYQTSRTLVELGLVIEKDSESGSKRRYDRFRDRLMFGIRDARGRLVGWGGRCLDGSDPKYLNSPQSVLFDKSSQLFGVFEAREAIRSSKQVVVTEGYMDAVANSMAGIEQTVATMGTACTSFHLERLVALAPEVVFCFDGDKAGINAAWKSLKTCLPYATDERTFRFLILPDGMDPDEVIQARGAQAYKSMLEEASPLSGFMLSHLAQENDNLKTAEDRARFLSQGDDLVRQLPIGNLRRIIKSAMLKASASAPDDEAIIQIPATPNRRKDRLSSTWTVLTTAVKAQPHTAASHAAKMIETLSPPMQDAFFSSQFELMPETQRAFWKALDECILIDDPVDTINDIGLAQRDLLINAVGTIAGQIMREDMNEARLSLRAGTTSEDQFLTNLQNARSLRSSEGI